MVIPTVAVEADKKENTVCPVCREEFDTFYKQVLLLNSKPKWFISDLLW